jgi:hypothetical protein
MCYCVNGYKALLGFGGVQLGWGEQMMKAGSPADGDVWMSFWGRSLLKERILREG